VLQLPCGPEKVDTLLKTVKKEFNDMAVKGPDQSYLDKVKKQWLETYKVQMKDNNAWLDQLISFKSRGGDPKRFLEYEKYVNALTTKDVQQAASLILNGKNQFFAVLMPEAITPPNTIASRKVNVQQTIEISKPEFQVDLYDNGDIDGDSVTVYFNGQMVIGKQKLTDKPITIKLKANPNLANELVMYANNLGTIPPNTALMKVTAGDKTYEVRLESDTDKSGAVVFKLKQ
jgi:zinc protease